MHRPRMSFNRKSPVVRQTKSGASFVVVTLGMSARVSSAGEEGGVFVSQWRGSSSRRCKVLRPAGHGVHDVNYARAITTALGHSQP